MIVWIKKEASKRPNNQRAKIIYVHPKTRAITVTFCGGIKPKALCIFKIKDIYAIELKGVRPKALNATREKVNLIINK